MYRYGSYRGRRRENSTELPSKWKKIDRLIHRNGPLNRPFISARQNGSKPCAAGLCAGATICL